MMNKPAEWDNTEAFTGDFKVLKPGGYVCKIMGAKEMLTQSGKQQLVIMFDIVEGEFKNYYTEQYDKKVVQNPDAKWQGVYRQLTEGDSLKYFKGMITAIENSNPGYKWNWNEESLKGKLFGGLFGQEEYMGQDGTIKLSTKCRFIRSVEQVRNGIEVPAVKKLHNSNSGFNVNSFGQDIPEEEIPF